LLFVVCLIRSFVRFVSGKSPSKETPTIVFLSGFPDSSDSWNRLAAQFEKTHHVITLAMPDYESKHLRQWWGYSMTDIMNGLVAVIEPHVKRGSSIHLVGHDWGAAICMMYSQAYSNTITKLVLLDIGERKAVCWRSLSYMLFLSWIFLVSRVSDILALLCIGLYPWGMLGPCPYEMVEIGSSSSQLEVPPNKGFKAFMCYPYFTFFRHLAGQVLGGKGVHVSFMCVLVFQRSGPMQVQVPTICGLNSSFCCCLSLLAGIRESHESAFDKGLG
jgi:pimeloyl-ACP methyl ester carboxylesterase